MKLPGYLRLSRFGIYLFRRRIPRDILDWFVTNEIRMSLRTGNLSQAVSNARILAAETEGLFYRLRINMLTDDDKKKFARMLDAKRLEMRLRGRAEELEDALVEEKLSQLALKKQHERELSLVLAASSTPPAVSKPTLAPLLSELIMEFLSAPQVGRRSDKPSTHRKDSDALNLFLAIVGDKPINQVLQADAALYANNVRTFNARGEQRSTGTVNNHMSSVGKFSRWVTAFHSGAGHIQLEFQSLRFKKVTTAHEERQMFEPCEVLKILNHPEFLALKRKDKSKFWLIAIAAYSGMRLEEIAQLNPNTDVIVDEDGVLVFDINNNDGKSLKTLSGARKVPVHRELIKLGLEEYVGSIKPHATKLFPDTKVRDGRQGKNIGKKANYFINKVIGIEGKTLHSFRHTFITLLKRGMVDESITAALAGHQHGGISYTRYGKGYEAKTLKAVIDTHISYDRS